MLKIANIKVLNTQENIFEMPSGICYSAQSQIFYIADMGNHRIVWIDKKGHFGFLPNKIAEFAPKGVTELKKPLALACCNNELYIADALINNIFTFDLSIEQWRPVIKDETEQIGMISGITTDGERNKYFVDFSNNRICKVDDKGKLSLILDGKNGVFNKVYGIFHHRKQLFFTDTENRRIACYDINKCSLTFYDDWTGNDLMQPIALAVDEKDNFYISEPRRILFFSKDTGEMRILLDKSIWKEISSKFEIDKRLCHLGAICLEGDSLFCLDTIKGFLLQIDFTKEG